MQFSIIYMRNENSFIYQGTMMPPSTNLHLPIYNVCPLHAPQIFFPACKFYSVEGLFKSFNMHLCVEFAKLYSLLAWWYRAGLCICNRRILRLACWIGYWDVFIVICNVKNTCKNMQRISIKLYTSYSYTIHGKWERNPKTYHFKL